MLTIKKEQIEAIELSAVGGEEYIAFVNERAFNVGPILYKIIHWLQNHKTLAEITALIAKEEEIEVTEAELAELVNTNFKQLGITASEDHKLRKRRSEYIYGKVRIVGEDKVAWLSHPLEFLFNRPVFVGLSLLGVIFTCLFYYQYGNWIKGQVLGDATQIVTIYLTLAAIFFFHEVGHTSAASRFGVRAKEIGFGFYFIFPVFFTDVTRIYGISKWKRIIVNLGGVYYQLIINALFIGIWYLLPWSATSAKVWLSLLVSTNTFVLLYSLNPFFRNDGYWIYSDLFNVKNMLWRGYRYPFTLIAEAWRGRFKPRDVEWPLLLFALANFAFIGSFVGVFIQQFADLSVEFYETLVSPSFWDDLEKNKGFLVKCIAFYGIVTFFLSRYVKILRALIQRRLAANTPRGI